MSEKLLIQKVSFIFVKRDFFAAVASPVEAVICDLLEKLVLVGGALLLIVINLVDLRYVILIG